MNLESEEKFFNDFAEIHGEYDVLGKRAYRKILENFFKQVPVRSGDRIADLGCGSGAFTRRLSQATKAKVLGVDLSPGLIAAARQQSKGEEYRVGDITKTGLPEVSLDAITYSGVLHHFPEAKQRVQVLSEGYRILCPGGSFFSFDPNWNSPSMWLYRDPASPLCSRLGKTESEVLLRRQQIQQEATEAGFISVRVFGVSGITFRYVAGRFARVFLPLYNLYERVMEKLPWEDRLGTFLVACGTKGLK